MEQEVTANTVQVDTEHQAASPVDLWMGIVFPYANFAIFLAMLIYFVRKPAVTAATKTREDYERLLAEANAARTEATSRLAELKAREQRLDQEIAEIKTMSQHAAELEAAKIVSDAEQLSAHLREEARRIAEVEIASARSQLRQEIVAAVRDGVAKKIAAEVKPETHLTLVRKQIETLQTIKA